jgi:hypothetical protein
VRDRWGGSWRVGAWRASVVPAPRVVPGPEALAGLLAPPWRPSDGTADPVPAASWVMGRSARWQGPDAPGAGEDPLAEQARQLRVPLAAFSAGGEPSLLRLVVVLGRTLGQLVAAARTVQDERSRPWLVELRAPGPARRSATWLVAGPEAAAVAVEAVVVAVRAGRVPEPPGARLVDVQDLGWRTAQR